MKLKLLILVLLVAQLGVCAQPTRAANITITAGGRVTLELLYADSDFRNTLSLLTPNVGVAISGCKLEPAGGLMGMPILSEKLSQHGCRVELDANPATPTIDGFAANTPFEFRFCAQTNADEACEFIWSSNPTDNIDGIDHVRITTLVPGSVYQMAWEDLPGGGDNDFNDIMAVLRVSNDKDGDGLWDDWEQSGIDTDGDGISNLDLPALGANPNRRDIFVEIDSMDCAVAGSDCPDGMSYSHRPKPAAIQAVIDAFAQAPGTNPDGSTGIALHVDVNNAIPNQHFLALGCTNSGGASFDAIKSNPAFFGTQNPRRFAYHYAVFGHRQGPATTSSGCAERPGNDLIVTLGEWNTLCIAHGPNGVLDTPASGDDLAILGDTHALYAGPNLRCDTVRQGDDVQTVAIGRSPTADLDEDGLDDRNVGTVTQQAITLMHELGHNLGLGHGGGDDINHKPNYQSVMNYSFVEGIPPTNPAGPLFWKVDFSKEKLADLSELNLNELVGIGASNVADLTYYYCPNGTLTPSVSMVSAIDWSCDGDNGTDSGAIVDINDDHDLTTLSGFNDWANVKLDFQNADNFEEGDHSTTTDIIELNYSTYSELPGVVDLAIQNVSAPSVIYAGEPAQFVFDVSNLGPVPASEVTIRSALPSGLTVIQISPTESCASTSRVLTCTVAALSNGDHAYITLTANTDPTILDGTTLDHIIVISRAFNEASLSNNIITSTLTLLRQSNLTITQTRQPAVVFAGQPVTYHVRIQNTGPSIATGIIVTDVLPAGVTFDEAGSSAGCQAKGDSGLVTCSVGTVLDASGKSLTVVGRVSATMPPGSLLTNTVSTTSLGRDPNVSDNVATHTSLLYGRAYLPIIASSRTVMTPSHEVDLIVRAITMTAQSVEVVIQNIGPGTLPANAPFWVDVYISPTVVPTCVNQTWQSTFSSGGLVWAIPASASTLGPQASLILRVGDRYFAGAESLIPRNISAGARIYAQVDSANTLTDFGGVQETHEIRGSAYNNIFMVTLSQPINTNAWPRATALATQQRAMFGVSRPDSQEQP